MRAQCQARIDPWSDPARVFGALPGAWSLARRISDGTAMAGTAVFAPAVDGDGLAYREQGSLRLVGGEVFQAERRYVFQPRPAGFAVFFAETPLRLFHEVALAAADRTLSGEAAHLCANDRYASRYAFHPDGSFSIRHVVSGPRKAYTLDTRYRRIEVVPV